MGWGWILGCNKINTLTIKILINEKGGINFEERDIMLFCCDLFGSRGREREGGVKDKGSKLVALGQNTRTK